MQILNEIIRQSAIGSLSKWYQSAVLLVFSSIVVMLFTMLVVLLANASQISTNFSYLFGGII
ncbi:MAG: hypothetical protein KJN70_00385 [Eudoraea sp.]|nr:hypothetical protein [Eudoraea sp.]